MPLTAFWWTLTIVQGQLLKIIVIKMWKNITLKEVSFPHYKHQTLNDKNRHTFAYRFWKQVVVVEVESGYSFIDLQSIFTKWLNQALIHIPYPK